MARPNHPRAMAVMTAMAAAMVMVLVAPGLARAQSTGSQITVNTADDTMPNGDGACSLREAIINANNNDQSGSTDCPAGSVTGEDSIVFDLGSTATIVLSALHLAFVHPIARPAPPERV